MEFHETMVYFLDGENADKPNGYHKQDVIMSLLCLSAMSNSFDGLGVTLALAINTTPCFKLSTSSDMAIHVTLLTLTCRYTISVTCLYPTTLHGSVRTRVR